MKQVFLVAAIIGAFALSGCAQQSTKAEAPAASAEMAAYEAALAAGAADNGGPGYRDYWPGYYAAFVYDPDGHNIEAVWYDYGKAD